MPAGPQEEDCTSCRMVGTGVCLGTSATLALQLYRGVPAVASPVHRAALAVCAASFAALGVVRAVI
jgi:hypothetical protein